MKKSLLMLTLAVGFALAQPQTFRSKSTEGMIPDDLDLWLSGLLFTQPVPDRLLDLEGIRVYSGLSNLANGGDMVFQEADSTRGSFLLGGSWSPVDQPFGIGLFSEFMNDRILEELELPGPGGIPLVTGSGEVEGTWSEYTDTNGDGIFDTQHTVYQKASGSIDSTTTDAGVFGAYAPSEIVTIGLGLSMNNTVTETKDADSNNSITVSDSNLVTGTPTYLMQNTISGTDKETSDGLEISLSGRGDVSDLMTIGGMFLFTKLSLDVSMDEQESFSENFLPAETNVFDNSVWNRNQEFSVAPDGHKLGGGLDLAYTIDDVWKMELAGAYYTTSVDGTSNNSFMSFDSTRTLTVGSLTETTDVEMSGSGGMDVDFSSDLVITGVKFTATPSDGLIISMAGAFSTHSYTSTMLDSSYVVSVTTFSDGDDVFADPDDYVSTSTWSQTEETKTTTETTRISIPVGLEFGVLPKVCVRLGASPAFVWQNETETVGLVSASPITTHTVFGDGTETQFVENPWTTSDGTRTESDDSYTEIPFNYGIGYSHSDNLQIDLMGLSRSLDEWRLSATLSF